MKKQLQVLFILMFVLFTISGVTAAPNWEYRETSDDVAVYTRAESGSRVPIVKAITVVAATPDQVWKKITGGVVKVDGLKERRTLGSCGQGCDYLYVRFGNWMITDRHYIVRIQNETVAADGGMRLIRSWRKTDERRFPDTGAMDVKKISGSWIMEPMDGGKKTRLIYINHLDLGGNVPPFLFTLRFVEKSVDIVKVIRSAAEGR